jgi:hypothetical protein
MPIWRDWSRSRGGVRCERSGCAHQISIGATLCRAGVLSHTGSTALTLIAMILDRLTQGIAERLESPPTR